MTFTLECHDVGRRFSDGQREIDVLRNFSAQWSLGSLVGIGGPSGAGKSTLLGILAGLDSSYSGSVKLDGRELSELSESARARLRQRHVAFAFQTPHLFPHLSIRQNLEVAADISNSHEQLENHLREFTERLSLQALLEKPPETLSGGERRRASLLRTLLSPANVLLFDEPGAHLDTALQREVMSLLQDVASAGRLVLFSSHNLEHLNRADCQFQLGGDH